MGSFANILQDWASVNEAKNELYIGRPELLLRWLNEAQLRYCSKSEMVRGVWEPTITSSGNISLPSDFLREIKDRVKWADNEYLIQIDHPSAIIMDFTGTHYYSIWADTFYVWGAAAGNPEIPYIKKPTVVAIGNIGTASLEIPTEFHSTLLTYLDAMYERERGNIAGYRALINVFDEQAREEGVEYRGRRDPVPVMRGTMF